MSKTKAIIIGSGIGGLTAAIALRRAGCALVPKNGTRDGIRVELVETMTVAKSETFLLCTTLSYNSLP